MNIFMLYKHGEPGILLYSIEKNVMGSLKILQVLQQELVKSIITSISCEKYQVFLTFYLHSVVCFLEIFMLDSVKT